MVLESLVGTQKNTFNVDDVYMHGAAAAGLDAGTYPKTGASIGTKQGFSIIQYVGNATNGTIPHGFTSTKIHDRQEHGY